MAVCGTVLSPLPTNTPPERTGEAVTSATRLAGKSHLFKPFLTEKTTPSYDSTRRQSITSAHTPFLPAPT